MITLWLLWLAHFLGDFPLGPNGVLPKRIVPKGQSYFIHLAVLAGSLFLALHIFGVYLAAGLGVAIALVHTFVDWVTNTLGRRASAVSRFWLFVANQTVHLIALTIAWRFVPVTPNSDVVQFYGSLMGPRAMSTLSRFEATSTPFIESAVVVALAYVVVVFVGAVLIEKGLDVLEERLASNELVSYRKNSIGSVYVGMLERAVLVTFVLAGAWSGAGLVIAAKAVRHQFFDKSMPLSDYYLVGSLASILVALVGGVVAGAYLAAK